MPASSPLAAERTLPCPLIASFLRTRLLLVPSTVDARPIRYLLITPQSPLNANANSAGVHGQPHARADAVLRHLPVLLPEPLALGGHGLLLALSRKCSAFLHSPV